MPTTATLADLRREADAISARLEDGTATDDDLTRAPALAGEIRQLMEADGAAEQEAETRRVQAEEARAALRDLPAPSAPRNPAPAGDRNPEARETRAPVTTRESGPQLLHRMAEGFNASRQLQEFRARGLSGQTSFDFADLRGSEFAQRATIDSTGGPVRNPYVPGVVSDVRERGLTILDLIDRQTTNLSSVPYVQETTTQAAREADALEVAEGTAKPEATAPVLVEVDSPVRTIAAWNNVTRQMAEDNATLYGIVQGRLPAKVLWRLNAQVLNGNGTAPNLRGIMNTSGINTYAPGTAEARVLSIRKGITLCQVDEYAPNAVGMNPTDWETVELDRDNNGQFRVSASLQNLGTPRLWGLAVVVSTYFTAGVALLGDFTLGATLFERSGVRLLMTDSHASNFTSNILTLLAEMRAALVVWRPSAFCKVTFNGTT